MDNQTRVVTLTNVPAGASVRPTQTLTFSANEATHADANVARFEIRMLGVWLEAKAVPTGEGQSTVIPKYRVCFQMIYPDEGLS